MQESKAIRPEIKGLFDTVKQQSKYYIEAFEQLNSFKSEYQQLIGDVNNLAESLALKVNHEIFSLKQKYDSIIKVLTIETNNTLEKYKELSDLSHLQDTYSQALQSINQVNVVVEKNILQLRKDAEEFHRELNYIKVNSDKEIKNLIDANKEYIKKIVSDEKIASDAENIAKFKNLDSRLSKTEQYSQKLSNDINNDIKSIQKELANLKMIVKNISNAEDNAIKAKLNEINANLQKNDLVLSSLNEEVYHLKIKNESIFTSIDKNSPDKAKLNSNQQDNNKLDEISKGSITAIFGKDNIEEYNRINKRLHQNEIDYSELLKKYNSLQIISISAISIAIIGIIIALIV